MGSITPSLRDGSGAMCFSGVLPFQLSSWQSSQMGGSGGCPVVVVKVSRQTWQTFSAMRHDTGNSRQVTPLGYSTWKIQ